MCKLCLSYPCDKRCPNSYIPLRYVGHCKQCDTKILDDETYYKDNEENMFCSEECAEEYYGIKEIDY